MPKRSSKRTTDPNQLAALIVSQSTGEAKAKPRATEKNPAAVALGRLGGLKGGKARAEKLSARKRQLIAQKAAQTRWERQAQRQEREP